MGNHASKRLRGISSKATMRSSHMLQGRTSDVISNLATGDDESLVLSLDTLKEVTACLFEMNQEMVDMILDCKQDLWKDQELVEDYFESSFKTLDFYNALEICLGKARANQLLVLIAFHKFEDESRVEGGNGYKKTLEELKNFKEAESPFNEDFFNMSQSVYEQQLLMLEKLHHRGNKLDKKLSENVINSMESGTCVEVEDLDDIRDLIAWLEFKIKGLVKCAEFAVEHEVVKSRINEIKRKLEVFNKNVDDLGVGAQLCSKAITSARTMVLKRIIHEPDNP